MTEEQAMAELVGMPAVASVPTVAGKMTVVGRVAVPLLIEGEVVTHASVEGMITTEMVAGLVTEPERPIRLEMIPLHTITLL